MPDLPWYLLYDLQDDQVTDWQETLALLPLLRHLHPPLQLRPITIARRTPLRSRHSFVTRRHGRR